MEVIQEVSKHRANAHPGSKAQDSILDRDQTQKCGIIACPIYTKQSVQEHIIAILGVC